MSKRRWGEKGLCVFLVLAMLVIFSPIATAQMTTSFHGYIESNIVLRDVDGAQYGFFDQTEAVQQRNTLKFDVDVDPDIDMGPFRVEKVHLTFRGAYDSIFDLRANEYSITRDLGASRFDYGEEDIRFEQDLREAFIDFAYKGSMGNRAFFRAGRQLVSWGESGLETMNDIINPPDQSYQMFFQNPDDVKIPLWMGRLNFDLPRFARTSINFDLLWIPDIRPTQFGPMDSATDQPGVGMQAPYVRCLPYAAMGQTVYQNGLPFINGATVRQDVPTNNNEYGGKVSAQIGDRFSLSLLYFRDVVNDAGMVLNWDNAELAKLPAMMAGMGPPPNHLIDSVTLTHNKQHVYGGYFSYQLLVGRFEAVIRGEVSHYTKYPVAAFNVVNETAPFDASFAPNPLYTGSSNAFHYKPVTKCMLAFDKDLRLRWFSPHDLTKITVEWLHTTINEWHGDNLDQPEHMILGVDRENIREQDSFYFQVMTNWWASKLSPMIVCAFTPGKHGEGTTYMLRPSIKWTITPNLYTEAVVQAFFGDEAASYAFGKFVNGPSEATIKLGYEW